MLSTAAIAELCSLLLNERPDDAVFVDALRQSPSVRDAAILILKSDYFLDRHLLEIGQLFDLQAEITPFV